MRQVTQQPDFLPLTHCPQQPERPSVAGAQAQAQAAERHTEQAAAPAEDAELPAQALPACEALTQAATRLVLANAAGEQITRVRLSPELSTLSLST